nr:BadF/BadG/BcrA/BcrD ATPase family protein [Agromyces seonyuensis]
MAVAEDAPEPLRDVSFGVSGLTPAEAKADELLESLRPFGTRRVRLAHDSVSAYLGALDTDFGAVVAAGTGVVTLGVGAGGVARVDGWGFLIGDAGSGYWIGRAALDAVLRAHDGRGAATSLSGPVLAEFPDVEAAYIELQSDPAKVARIARYSAVVAEHAPDDAVARGILELAGDEMAGSVLAALSRVGERENPAPKVRAIGGVFRSPDLFSAFESSVRLVIPGADVAREEARPLEGVARLPHVTPDHPLAPHVAVAGVPPVE